MSKRIESNKRIYKSFEQWKADTFPKLIADEKKQLEKTDMEKTGISLANASFDHLLSRL